MNAPAPVLTLRRLETVATGFDAAKPLLDQASELRA